MTQMLTSELSWTAAADDEHALIAAVARGDSDAFERLYRIYERRVFQYTLTFVRDAALAEEIAADTMFAVWRGAASFGKSSRVSTWILGIARHKAIDAVRRVMRAAPAVPLEEAVDLADTACGPIDATQQRSLERLTHHAFQRLSAEHREVLYLAFYEDVPYEEIAALLDVPHNTVKTRVYYAKQKLKEHLERLTVVEAMQ
jgi:RNA polymerase sigma-70 factor (ECF subfamily)